MSSESPGTNDDLILVGPAPCWEAEFKSLPSGIPVGAICEAGLHLKKFDYWITCHNEFAAVWGAKKRKKSWRWVMPPSSDGCGDIRFNLPLASGSSSLYAALFGMANCRGRILMVGCPMAAPEYIPYRLGWIQYASLLQGRVFSASGWTRQFLERLGNRWPF